MVCPSEKRVPTTFGLTTVWACLLSTCVVAHAQEKDKQPRTVRITDRTVVRFAGVEEGKKALSVNDRFLQSMSKFDLQVRLQTDKPVTIKQYLAFISGEVREWPEEEVKQLSETLASVRERFKPFDLPLPKTVLFVKTTGKEEGGAAYCRKNSVILPTSLLKRIGRNREGLLIHELFHVLSSHNPKLRDKLYAIVGFRRCPQIAYPPTLKDRALTNPDGPVITHYMTLDDGKTRQHVVPVLYSSIPQYDPKKGGTIFTYFRFRLMVVEKKGKKFAAKLEDGEPILLQAEKQESFMKQIGSNTRYMIHPDEILADNFIYLVTGKKVQTPRVTDAMRALLQAAKSD